MDLSSQETLQQLLLRLTDPELSSETHAAAAARIRERFPIEDWSDEYAHIVCHGLVDDGLIAFILRILYVQACRDPDDPEPKEAFLKVMAGRSRSRELRTQAFLHLLLLDIDLAERAAAASMPEMAALAAVERRYPTIRRLDDPVDAAFEEATLKLLFH